MNSWEFSTDHGPMPKKEDGLHSSNDPWVLKDK